MEITGRVVKVLEEERFTGKDNGVVVKCGFVLETGGQYPKTIAFNVFGEGKISQMGVVAGRDYNVSFDMSSREHKGRWYTEATAWKAVCLNGPMEQTANPQQYNPQPQPQPIPKPIGSYGNNGDIPF